MKLKFLSLGLLALSFVACDSYEESDSVAAMRNARAEVFQSEAAINLAKATFEEANAAYRNAEAAFMNFQAALEETKVKAAQLANAKTEALDAMDIAEAQVESDNAMLKLANDKVVLANALIDLENAKIVLDGQKLQAEYAFSAIANGLITDANNDLNTAFGLYTGAYGDWNTATNKLLTANNNLIYSKFDLAGLMYDFDNMDVQGDKEADIALLNITKAELMASLTVVSDLKATNDWDAFIVERDAMKADMDAAEAIQTNKSNADVATTMVAQDAADEAADVAEAAATEAADAVTAASTAKDDAYTDIKDWKNNDAPAAGIDEDRGIYAMVAARQAGLAIVDQETLVAKTAVEDQKVLIVDKQKQIDDDNVTAGDKAIYENDLEVLNEELATKIEIYNAKKAISDAFVATFDADVAVLNAAYFTAIEAFGAASDAKDAADLVATDAASDAKDATTAADAATAAEDELITVMKTEVARLDALVFVYNTSTEDTDTAILGVMTENIDNAIEDLESDIKDNEDKIYADEKILAEIVAGDYGQSQAVRAQELVIVMAEADIAELTLKVAQAKADLDARQAEYNALLED
ncbi:MAG: hypothetical protein ACERIH_02985 [Labilibaculum antarcticum]